VTYKITTSILDEFEGDFFIKNETLGDINVELKDDSTPPQKVELLIEAKVFFLI